MFHIGTDFVYRGGVVVYVYSMRRRPARAGRSVLSHSFRFFEHLDTEQTNSQVPCRFFPPV